jgi:hypothetical protein
MIASKKLLSFFSFTAILSAAFMLLNLGQAQAAFVASRLMDDGIMDSYNVMSAADIDAFLNSRNSCISTGSGFSARDPVGYNPSDGFLYGGNVSAGTIIAHSAQVYEINPRVLIVTLQKEQSIITSTSCSTNTISKAMGYGCPDGGSSYSYSGLNLYTRSGVTYTDVSGICVNQAQKAGFTQQVIRAAWLLKFSEQRSKGNVGWNIQKPGWDNSDDPQSFYSGYMTQGYHKRIQTESSPTYYDGYATIDGVSTHMDTGATAALYRYTPHFHGNQNFVNLYESWFGPTKGVDYAWEYVGISFSTGSANVMGNTQVNVTLTARNTGNQSWSNSNFPARLGTFAPTNHGSALYHSSWVNQIRPATVSQAVVMPGENGTFAFTINVPNISGPYYERFNLVAEGAVWMQDPDFSIQLNVTRATYKYQMVSQNSTNGWELTPGQSSQFTLVARNTGNTTWSNSSAPVKLATWAPSYRRSAFDPGTWENPYRVATLQESSVAPGANGTFVFNVTAPTSGGFYAERFNLVSEGLSWFEDPWVEFDVHVGNFYRWQMVSQSSSTGTFTMARNSTATFTLTVRNTGNVTWSNSSMPVRLATWNPPYRSSAFNDGSWINAYRVVNLTQSSVAPGATGTFVFTVRAPNTAGFYVERFNLVAEGLAWFADPWMEFDILVQ